MIVLGIESATPVASVGIVGNGLILAEKTVNNKRTHSVNLLPMVKEAIESVGLQREDIAGIALSSGPGSFTGLRIGMAIGKTLAQAWKIPIVGVSTLETLSQSLAGHNRLICPLLNARRNEVYAAVYRSSDFELGLVKEPMAVGIKELVESAVDLEGQITFLGEGVPLYQGELRKSFGERALFAPSTTWCPRGALTAYLGWRKLLSGEGGDYLSLLPYYIRLSEAEAKWLKRQGN